MNGQKLRRDVELLSSLLHQVVSEQTSPERRELVEELQRLARERRADLPGAEEQLAARIRSLSEDEIQTAVRALSAFFDLANIAEDCRRIRVLRERERLHEPHPRAESVGAAVEQLQSDGLSAEQVQTLLDRLQIELVFTAHPTEAKRRTMRRLMRQIRIGLQDLDHDDLLRRQRDHLLDGLSAALSVLWQVDPMRPTRPTVMQEVERGLFFVEGLWEVVPQIYRDLRQTLAQAWPGHSFRIGPFLQFGTWIGGDRDGNPFVTCDVTARTLQVLRRTAVERHLTHCRELERLLVMSERQIAISNEIRQAVAAAESKWPGLADRMQNVSESELYRRWLKVVEYRLEQTLAAADRTDSLYAPSENTAGYREAAELEADLRSIVDSVADHRGARIVDEYLQGWLDQLQTFGLHLAALDVRQDSRVHVEVLTQLMRHRRLCDDYAALDEQGRLELLEQTMTDGESFNADDFADPAQETVRLFELLAQVRRHWGGAPLGGHVLSMTHSVSDILAILWLWHRGWNAAGNVGRPPAYLPIVPLFETIEDLQRGPEVLDALLSNRLYRDYLQQAPDPAQVVMVGYSDSTKDGGYLSASWGLHRAQERLAEVAQRHGVRLIVFHGRGGALGRGGGPAARAILSLPPQSVDGALRMTEQGEVLAERYDDPQIAHRHLEQVTWATMLVTAEPRETAAPEWVAVMHDLDAHSYRHYRQLVEHPQFLAYFDQATPISEIENLPIASRPSRRRERRSLADLRAIPWTFAWTQCRQLIPAWFGLGTAVHQYVAGSGGKWTVLEEMYDHWPHFRALIDNADLALAKADLSIAHRYAQLAGDQQAGRQVWELVSAEYAVSRAAVLMITRQPQLLGGVPWLQRSIQERNPYVDPLNLIQVELIRRLRSAPDSTAAATLDRWRELTRLTIQGIAAGLRTTG